MSRKTPYAIAMRCSTCGESLQPGATRCPTCGTSTPIGMAIARPSGVRRCPRCSYQGEGMPYFRRAGNIGLLVLASCMWMLPGIVYWLARRTHLICPRCGLDWEHSSRALQVTAGGEPVTALIEQEPDQELPSSGFKRRFLGTAGVLFGAFMILMGIVEAEAAAAVVGSFIGAAGSATFYWGWQGLLERRKAIMHGLQRKILKLASMKGGQLTVTEVAADLNLALPAAEKILGDMDDGFRVRSDISKEGVIYYEFPELMHRKEIGSGS